MATRAVHLRVLGEGATRLRAGYQHPKRVRIDGVAWGMGETRGRQNGRRGFHCRNRIAGGCKRKFETAFTELWRITGHYDPAGDRCDW